MREAKMKVGLCEGNGRDVESSGAGVGGRSTKCKSS